MIFFFSNSKTSIFLENLITKILCPDLRKKEEHNIKDKITLERQRVNVEIRNIIVNKNVI